MYTAIHVSLSMMIVSSEAVNYVSKCKGTPFIIENSIIIFLNSRKIFQIMKQKPKI